TLADAPEQAALLAQQRMEAGDLTNDRRQQIQRRRARLAYPCAAGGDLGERAAAGIFTEEQSPPLPERGGVGAWRATRPEAGKQVEQPVLAPEVMIPEWVVGLAHHLQDAARHGRP